MEPAMTLTDDFAGLEDHVAPDGTFNPPTKQVTGVDAKVVKFPCTGCGGSGVWRGRGKCFACGGKGYFLTSERDRRNARVKRVESKAKKLADTRAAFDAEYPDVATFLAGATWSPFAQELAGKLAQSGALTERQVIAVRSMATKCAERRAARDAERNTGNAEVDLSPIRTMFETARANGKKTPIYRAAGLIINRAPDSGKNPGALYVKDEAGMYLGKILGTQYTGKPAPALAAIAADPRGEAIRYGKTTGTCSCCGAELTNGKSIALGIGPICASKWGL
jgi:hypothetical protein